MRGDLPSEQEPVDEALLEELLILLAGIDSRSGREHRAAEALAAWGADHGLSSRVDQVAPGRSSAVLELAGKPGQTVLFSGHIDTLEPKDEIPGARIGRTADRFFGPEVNNMKAAVAAMAVAMVQMSRQQAAGNVTLLAAASECDTIGLGTVAALREGIRADAAINGEPTDLAILAAHAGVGRARIITRGIAAHVSQSQRPASAIDALARVIVALDSSTLAAPAGSRFAGMPSLNIGMVSGGVAASIIAPEAEAQLDIRWPPGTHFRSLFEGIADLIAGVELPEGCSAAISLLEEPDFLQPNAFLADPDWAPVRAVATAHMAVTGRECEFGDLHPQVFFGSDAPHLVDAGIPTCIYGPGAVRDINIPEESIRWADVVTACAVYRRAAEGLAEEPPPQPR